MTGRAPLVTVFAALLALPVLLAPAAEAQSSRPRRPPVPHTDASRLTVEHHPAERVVELVVGPVELPDGMPHLRLPVQMAEMPARGWLRGFEWRIVDGEGERLPDELLHHVNLVDPDHRQLFAPTPRRVLAAGRETRSAMLPPVLGIPFTPDSRYMVSAMFANSTGTDYPEAWLRVRIHYVKADDRLVRPHTVFPFYLDVTGPVGGKDFTVPPGRTVKAWEGSPAVAARILGAGGHLHDYAEEIRLVDLTTGRVLWSARPNASESGRVFSVPEGHFWWRGGTPVRPDHRYRVEVVYHNPTDEPAPLGGMGVLAGVVLPAGDWPRLDRSDRAYCLDLMNHVTAPDRLTHGHGHGSSGGDDGGGGHGHGGGGEPAYTDAPCRAAFGSWLASRGAGHDGTGSPDEAAAPAGGHGEHGHGGGGR